MKEYKMEGNIPGTYLASSMHPTPASSYFCSMVNVQNSSLLLARQNSTKVKNHVFGKNTLWGHWHHHQPSCSPHPFEQGARTQDSHTLLLLTSCGFIFPSHKTHILHNWSLCPPTMWAVLHGLPPPPPIGPISRNPCEAHLVDDSEENFTNRNSPIMHVGTSLSWSLGILLNNLLSFILNFNSIRVHWHSMPDKTWVTFGCVFMMESGWAGAFLVTFLMSLVSLEDLALSNVDLDTGNDPSLGGKDESNYEVALEVCISEEYSQEWSNSSWKLHLLPRPSCYTSWCWHQLSRKVSPRPSQSWL